jgi:hypothetical protein
MSDADRSELLEKLLDREHRTERVIEVSPEALDAAAEAGVQAVEGLDVEARWTLFAREIRLAQAEDDERIRRAVRQEMYLLSLFTNVDPAVSSITEHERWRALREGTVPIDEWIREQRDAALSRAQGLDEAPNVSPG